MLYNLQLRDIHYWRPVVRKSIKNKKNSFAVEGFDPGPPMQHARALSSEPWWLSQLVLIPS